MIRFSRQIKTAAKLFYKKLELADSFKPKLKLKSKVTLVKPTDNSAKMDEDYRLKEVSFNEIENIFGILINLRILFPKKVCTKPVEVHTVEGNHRTFLIEDQSLVTIQSILKRLFN